MKKQKFLVTKKGGIIQTVLSPNGAAKRQKIKEGTVIESSASDAQVRGLIRLGYLQEYNPQKAAPKPIAPTTSRRKKDAERKPTISSSETKDNS